MAFKQEAGALIEVAPSLFITSAGKFTANPPVSAEVIGQLGLAIPDESVKVSLLSEEDTKQDIIDKLGLFGDSRKLFEGAWEIGSTAITGYGYYKTAEKLLEDLGLIPKEDSPEMKAMKALAQKIEQAINLLKLVMEVGTADKIAGMENVRKSAESSARNFLKSRKPEEWDVLRQKVIALQESVWSQLFDPAISLGYMKAGWDVQDYYGAPWYYSFAWGFERAPFAAQDESIPVLGKLAAGNSRWDYRPWIALLARVTVTLIQAHLALDPASRTTGVYRDYLQGFAEGLRTFGKRIIAGIQVTRRVDLAKDWSQHKYGYGFEGYWGYDILANGWPVGAIDSISGAAVFDALWKPSAHGFPVLDTIKEANLGIGSNAISHGQLPPPPWTWAGLGALAKAETERNKGWFALVAASPAYPIFALASLFDDLARPPKTSETVALEGPEWVGVRANTGKQVISVGGIYCEKKNFTAEIWKLRRVATVKIRVQPNLYRWGSHEIKYRFLLETHELTSSGIHGVIRDQKELFPGKATLFLKAQTFHFDIEKPLTIGKNLRNDANVVYVIPPAPDLGDSFHLQLPPEGLKVGSIALQFAKGKSVLEHLVADTPLEERHGRLTPTGETKTLTYHCERSDEDGFVTITIRMDHGQSNALVWLVVEEPLGNVFQANPLSLPPVQSLRTGVALPMIGIERYLPETYFAHLDFCAAQAGKALKESAGQAQRKGLPIPEPDPRVDRNFSGYVQRVGKTLAKSRSKSRHAK